MAIYFFGKWVTMPLLKWTRISALLTNVIRPLSNRFGFDSPFIPIVDDLDDVRAIKYEVSREISSSDHLRTSSDLREHIKCINVHPARRVKFVLFQQRESVIRLGRTPRINLSTITLRSAYPMIAHVQRSSFNKWMIFVVVYRSYDLS